MKKKSFKKKLSLNKETVTKLNNEKMNEIKGGKSGATCRPGCVSGHYCSSWTYIFC